MLVSCVSSFVSGRAEVAADAACWDDAAWVLDEAESLLGVAAGVSDGLSGVAGS